MTKLLRRIERLEGKKGTASSGPSVIFICNAVTGEADVTLMVRGGSLAREAGEAVDAFEARVDTAALAKSKSEGEC